MAKVVVSHRNKVRVFHGLHYTAFDVFQQAGYRVEHIPELLWSLFSFCLFSF